MEVWSDVVGYEGYYSVSNQGRVRSNKRTISRPGGTPRTLPERMMAGTLTQRGYVVVSLRKPGERQIKKYVHRLVAEKFAPGFDASLEVNHIDGDKLNNCASNLEWCSHSHNMAHAWDNGLTPFSRRGTDVSNRL